MAYRPNTSQTVTLVFNLIIMCMFYSMYINIGERLKAILKTKGTT